MPTLYGRLADPSHGGRFACWRSDVQALQMTSSSAGDGNAPYSCTSAWEWQRLQLSATRLATHTVRVPWFARLWRWSFEQFEHCAHTLTRLLRPYDPGHREQQPNSASAQTDLLLLDMHVFAVSPVSPHRLYLHCQYCMYLKWPPNWLTDGLIHLIHMIDWLIDWLTVDR